MSMIEDAHEQYNQVLQHLPAEQLTNAQRAIARAIELVGPLFERAESREATDSLAKLRKALEGTEQLQQTTSQLRDRITAMQQRLGLASVGQQVEASPGNVLYDPQEGSRLIDYDSSVTPKVSHTPQKPNEMSRKEPNEATDPNPDAPKWYHQPIDEEDPLRRAFDARFRPLAVEARLEADTGPMKNPQVFELDEGDFNRVYITADDEHVIKIPKPENYRPEQAAVMIPKDIREKAAALRVGKGQPGLEQIVACSDDPYSPGIVCEFVKGIDSRRVTSAQVNAMTDQQLETLADALGFMQENGLNIDPIRTEHILFTPDKGVTIIDYTLQEIEDDELVGQNEPRQTIEDKITTIMNNETLLRLCPKRQGLPSVAARFREICRQRFGQSAADALTRRWHEDGFIS